MAPMVRMPSVRLIAAMFGLLAPLSRVYITIAQQFLVPCQRFPKSFH